MANNINFNVGFNTDISGLQEAQRELQKIKDMSLLDYTKEFKAGNFDSKEIQKEFNQIKKSASELEGAFTRLLPRINSLPHSLHLILHNLCPSGARSSNFSITSNMPYSSI